MKCSCCGNEMQSGFVRAMGRGGVCWVTENRPMGAAVGCPGFLLLGKAPPSGNGPCPCLSVRRLPDGDHTLRRGITNICCGTALAVPLFCIKFPHILF